MNSDSKLNLLISPSSPQDSNSKLLYDLLLRQMAQYLDSEHESNQTAFADFNRLLNQDDPQAIKKFFEEKYDYLVVKPDMLKDRLKNLPTYEVEHLARGSAYFGKKDQRRITIEPKLSITSKPIQMVLNNEDPLSQSDCALLEKYQLFLYYLSGVLYSIYPLMIKAAAFRISETGQFSQVEEPEKALKRDSMLRHMKLNMFQEYRNCLVKYVYQKLRLPAEAMFKEECQEFREFLRVQDLSLTLNSKLKDLSQQTPNIIPQMLESRTDLVVDDRVVKAKGEENKDAVSLSEILQGKPTSLQQEGASEKVNLLLKLRTRKAELEREIQELSQD